MQLLRGSGSYRTSRPKQHSGATGLAAAPAPILRRLAIHCVIARDLDPNDTIDWMLQHSSQDDGAARHERIRALKIAYPHASEDRRRAVIKGILAYRWPLIKDDKAAKFTISHQFSWLECLLEASPKCSLLQKALENLRQKYPDSHLREYPDKDPHQIRLYDAGSLSSWKHEGLVVHPARYSTDDLLEYQPVDPLQPDRRRLLDGVTREAGLNAAWGIDLAEDLLRRQHWDTDLWSSIYRSWSTMELDSSQCRRALQILGCRALHRTFAQPIACVLHAMVHNTNLPDHGKFISAVDDIAVDLWESIDGKEIPEKCDDWLIEAWNHPAGVLVQIWIDIFVFWSKRKEQDAAHFERYYSQFVDVILDRTAVGRLGRCVISRSLSDFLAINEAWTKDRLLPLLYDYPNCANRSEYAAMWDGLLRDPVNLTVAGLIKIPFLDYVTRMAQEPSPRRKRFVNRYIYMLAFFAGDPVETWIPELFKWANEDEQIMVARMLHELLENMNESQKLEMWQRWLRLYWQNRAKGIPKVLLPREAWHMLRWLPCLRPVFNDAVDVAIGMTPDNMEPESGRFFLLTLHESDLPTIYPRSVAKLLIYLRHCEYNNWYMGKELIDLLLQNDLPDDLKTGLRELYAVVVR